MAAYIGHITAGIAGSTIAAVVLDSGNLVVAAALIAICLGFVAVQLMHPRDGTRI